MELSRIRMDVVPAARLWGKVTSSNEAGDSREIYRVEHPGCRTKSQNFYGRSHDYRSKRWMRPYVETAHL